MSQLRPLIILHSGGLRTFVLYVTPSRTRNFAVTFESTRAATPQARVIGDRLENPSELVFSVYIEEVNQAASYALAYTVIEECETATGVSYQEGLQEVDGIVGASVVPDGLGVRLTLRFAPVRASLVGAP